MPKILHSLLPKSLHFWLPFTLISYNGYFAAITIRMYQDCQLEKAIEIGLRKKPDSYELTGVMPPELLEQCNDFCKGLGCKISDGLWWHIVTYIPIDTSVDQIVDYLKALDKFASSELK